ncbi:MAG: hypothetical protein ACE5H0_05795 [Bacteroidota bacterium]
MNQFQEPCGEVLFVITAFISLLTVRSVNTLSFVMDPSAAVNMGHTYGHRVDHAVLRKAVQELVNLLVHPDGEPVRLMVK